MKKKILVVVLILFLLIIFYLLVSNTAHAPNSTSLQSQSSLNPLSVTAMRSKSYPGSAITIEQQLPDGSNYHQYLASYLSDGLKIYALLTVPTGQKPANGWPVILFNHGYIAPETYQTFPSVGQYASYYPYFSSAGYIVFKPDYRGNGNSDGSPEGAYYSPAYATDDLNALSSIKKYPDANPHKIGIWGHSMGGNITLRDVVVRPNDVQAAVIWGGVVGSYDDLMNNWQRRVPFRPGPRELALRNASRQNLITKYGSPSANPVFWNSVDPTHFVGDITVPVQLDAGGEDEEVPVAFSQSLYERLKAAEKTVEFFTYPGDNHNISGHLNEAMQHSLDFFNKYLK
ncbi:MAG TPA: alpha/beta fold hydrolase [Patescibacteria group bacterium]|nr:alpha/beta fold hydrolase [Patescibacteria group bacterium]